METWVQDSCNAGTDFSNLLWSSVSGIVSVVLHDASEMANGFLHAGLGIQFKTFTFENVDLKDFTSC